MKKSAAILFTVLGMTVASVSAQTTEPGYISWAFDDFDNNGNVVESAEMPPTKSTSSFIEIPTDEDAGELGW